MSINQPQKFIGDNSAMLINLFQESLKQRTDSQPRFVIVSSGTVYDNTQPMPLKETSKLTYNNPYSISKILNENLCKYYETRGFDTIVVRPFNHTGPGQMGGFLIPDLTEQVLKAGPDGIISAGNLETRRDYSDVRDIVKGYVSIALADQLEPKLFNLCSGKSMSGKEMLDLIVKAVLGETGKVTVEVDQSKIRPNDLQEIYGDNSLAKQSFGWKPTISIDKTIADYVEWRRSTDK